MTKSKTQKRERGRKWDGRSRISTSKYKKNYNEINWGNMDEVANEINKLRNDNLHAKNTERLKQDD